MFFEELLKVLSTQLGWGVWGYLVVQILNIIFLPELKFKLISTIPLPILIFTIYITYQMWVEKSNIWPVFFIAFGNVSFIIEIGISIIFISYYLRKKPKVN